jgi:hypothetical protein
MWTIFAGATVSYNFDRTLRDAYESVFVEPNAGFALYTYRTLTGLLGGFIGWISLVALAFVSQRPWSRIPKPVKVGCLIGVISAFAFPAVPGLSLPPVLLCASILWLAAKRDA